MMDKTKTMSDKQLARELWHLFAKATKGGEPDLLGALAKARELLAAPVVCEPLSDEELWSAFDSVEVRNALLPGRQWWGMVMRAVADSQRAKVRSVVLPTRAELAAAICRGWGWQNPPLQSDAEHIDRAAGNVLDLLAERRGAKVEASQEPPASPESMLTEAEEARVIEESSRSYLPRKPPTPTASPTDQVVFCCCGHEPLDHKTGPCKHVDCRCSLYSPHSYSRQVPPASPTPALDALLAGPFRGWCRSDLQRFLDDTIRLLRARYLG